MTESSRSLHIRWKVIYWCKEGIMHNAMHSMYGSTIISKTLPNESWQAQTMCKAWDVHTHTIMCSLITCTLLSSNFPCAWAFWHSSWSSENFQVFWWGSFYDHGANVSNLNRLLASSYTCRITLLLMPLATDSLVSFPQEVLYLVGFVKQELLNFS